MYLYLLYAMLFKYYIYLYYINYICIVLFQSQANIAELKAILLKLGITPESPNSVKQKQKENKSKTRRVPVQESIKM